MANYLGWVTEMASWDGANYSTYGNLLAQQSLPSNAPFGQYSNVISEVTAKYISAHKQLFDVFLVSDPALSYYRTIFQGAQAQEELSLSEDGMW